MQSLRAILALVLLLLLVLVSGYWLWGRLVSSPLPQRSGTQPPVTATPTVAATPTLTPVRAPPGYRLAGVAVGVPDSFAVVEAPNGVNTLYRLNDAVPGLGRLVRIEAERAVVAGAGGQFELWLMPGATPTVGATRAPRHSVPRTAAPATATPQPQPQPVGGGTTPRSAP